MNTEPFDAQSCISTETDTQSTQPVSKCGSLEIALLYDAPMRKMTVHVLQARNMPSRDRGQPTHTQVTQIAFCDLYVYILLIEDVVVV